MTTAKQKLTEAGILFFGIASGVFAYLDTHKGWVALTILTATMTLDEVLVRLRHSEIRKPTV